jgi:hypothetical protein
VTVRYSFVNRRRLKKSTTPSAPRTIANTNAPSTPPPPRLVPDPAWDDLDTLDDALDLDGQAVRSSP